MTSHRTEGFGPLKVTGNEDCCTGDGSEALLVHVIPWVPVLQGEGAAGSGETWPVLAVKYPCDLRQIRLCQAAQDEGSIWRPLS
jgi:hypothetical protein